MANRNLGRNIVKDSSKNLESFFIKLFAFTFLSLVIIQLLRPSENGETWDKVLVAVSGAAGAAIFLSSLRSVKRSGIIVAVLALLAVVSGVVSIEKHAAINGVDINKILWFGFGPYVLLMICALIPFIYKVFEWENLSKVVKVIIGTLAFTVIPALILANWQGGSTLMEPDSPEYVINELLAVPAGNIPYVDFIPQYGILYSWLIAPFSNNLEPNQLVTLGLYLMSAGGILAVGLGVWLTYKAMNKRSLSLAILLIVPFTSLAQFPGRTSFSGSIYSTPTQIPIRIFVPLIAVALLLRQNTLTRKNLLISFIILGVNLWLNTDFGAASLIAALFIVAISSAAKRNFIYSIFGSIIGWLLYPTFLLIQGHKIQVDGFATFVRQFGNGFGSEPIQTPGPVLLILPLIVSLFFASSHPLYQERFRKQPIAAELRRAVLTANFFSLWSLIGFAYYLNRSYASGQMQILFLPLSISLASYLYYLTAQNSENLPWTPRTFFQMSQWKGRQLNTRLIYLPIALIMALPLATIIAFPNPSIEIDRLTNAPETNRWPLPKNKIAFSEFPKIVSAYGSENISYFGSSGNYVELEYGLESANIFNSPFDLFMSQNMINKGCSVLAAKGAKFVLLNDTGLVVAQNFVNQKLCGRYVFDVTLPKRLMRLE